MKLGLYGKFIIAKADGSDIPLEADYFVLRLDDDPHARNAALAYSESVQHENPALAKALEDLVKHYDAKARP